MSKQSTKDFNEGLRKDVDLERQDLNSWMQKLLHKGKTFCIKTSTIPRFCTIQIVLSFCFKEFGRCLVLLSFVLKMIGNPLGMMFKQNSHCIHGKELKHFKILYIFEIYHYELINGDV